MKSDPKLTFNFTKTIRFNDTNDPLHLNNSNHDMYMSHEHSPIKKRSSLKGLIMRDLND